MKQTQHIQRPNQSKIRNQSKDNTKSPRLSLNQGHSHHLTLKRVSLFQDSHDSNQKTSRELSNQQQRNQQSSKSNSKAQSSSDKKHKQESISFDGLKFLIEVYEGRKSMKDFIAPKIKDNGGIIVQQLNPDIQYLIFENGKESILQKVMNDPLYSNVKVIAPIWVQQCLSQNKILSHEEFRPRELLLFLEQESQMNNQSSQNNQQKKNSQSRANSSSKQQYHHISLRNSNHFKQIDQVDYCIKNPLNSNFSFSKRTRQDNSSKEVSLNNGSNNIMEIDRQNKVSAKKKRSSPTRGNDDERIIMEIDRESKENIAQEIVNADQSSLNNKKKNKKTNKSSPSNNQPPKNSNQGKKVAVQQTLKLPTANTQNQSFMSKSNLLQNQSLNFDKEDVDRTYKKVKEEYDFKKEFEKQIKKFNKMIEPFKQQQNQQNSCIMNQSTVQVQEFSSNIATQNTNIQDQTQLSALKLVQSEQIGAEDSVSQAQNIGKSQDNFSNQGLHQDQKQISQQSFNPFSQVNINQQMQQKLRRDPKYMTKNQLIETYIEGDIELYELIENIQPKQKKKGTTTNQYRKADVINNRRISEMCQNKNQNDTMMTNKEDHKNENNKSLLVSLQDYLLDLDDEEISQNENSNSINKPYQPHTQVNIPRNLKQGNLFNMGFHQRSQNDKSNQYLNQKPNQSQSIFNYKPQSIFSGLSNDRPTKSFTLQPQTKLSQNQPLDQIKESPRFGKENQSPNSRLFNFDLKPYKRANSCFPVLTQPLSEKSISMHENNFTKIKNDLKQKYDTSRKLNFNNEESSCNNYSELQQQKKQRQYPGTKNKAQGREWSRILPQRKNPQRGCKNNVSYIEDDNDDIPTIYDALFFKKKPIYNR